MSLSTHVLNAVTGRPAAGVSVRLEARGTAGWTRLEDRITNEDGRIADLAPDLTAGVYRLTFDVEHTFDVPSFYPEVGITFRVLDPAQHYHVPLLLSPYAYSTYRGS